YMNPGKIIWDGKISDWTIYVDKKDTSLYFRTDGSNGGDVVLGTINGNISIASNLLETKEVVIGQEWGTEITLHKGDYGTDDYIYLGTYGEVQLNGSVVRLTSSGSYMTIDSVGATLSADQISITSYLTNINGPVFFGGEVHIQEPTDDDHPVRKDNLEDAIATTVQLTGNQIISGNKKFNGIIEILSTSSVSISSK